MPNVIGIDIGGTKIASALVDVETGTISHRREIPAKPLRGGEAILADILSLAQPLAAHATAIGVGLPELVGADGSIMSNATVDWLNIPARERLSAILPTIIEADVRAAARAEARFGAGAQFPIFVYVTIGTGISCALMIEGKPYLGARGLSGTFASAHNLLALDDGRLAEGPPLEKFSSGPALSRRYCASAGFAIDTPCLLTLADSGNTRAHEIVETSARALGASIAQLVNTLDPAAVILGGGLGCAGGLFHIALEKQFRQHLWSEHHHEIPLLQAQLGPDAGLIGAALAATS